MIPEKTIQICGKEVKMRYCAAAETGYEALTGKPSTVFSPIVEEYGEDGKPTKVKPPVATTDDYLKLAIAAIVAAYARKDEEAPITAEEILYDASPKEITELMITVITLRNQWYAIPDVVPATETDEAPTPEDGKNVPPPATPSKRS
jgi:hypothetical protein